MLAHQHTCDKYNLVLYGRIKNAKAIFIDNVVRFREKNCEILVSNLIVFFIRGKQGESSDSFHPRWRAIKSHYGLYILLYVIIFIYHYFLHFIFLYFIYKKKYIYIYFIYYILYIILYIILCYVLCIYYFYIIFINFTHII